MTHTGVAWVSEEAVMRGGVADGWGPKRPQEARAGRRQI